MSGWWEGLVFSVFSNQTLIGQSLVGYASKRQYEAARVIQSFAIVETKRLLIKVSEQVKRLDRNIGAVDAALQKRPEVFHVVGVNIPST